MCSRVKFGGRKKKSMKKKIPKKKKEEEEKQIGLSLMMGIIILELSDDKSIHLLQKMIILDVSF